MINATFRPLGFTVTGHADHSERGTDIVCAAVSALVTSTVNGIENYVLTEIGTLYEGEGLVIVDLDDVGPITEALVATLYDALVDISESYPDNLKVLGGFKNE